MRACLSYCGRRLHAGRRLLESDLACRTVAVEAGAAVHPQGADRDALVGATGGVHRQQLRVAAQRLAAQAAAPGLEAAPGRVVDPARAVATGAAGVLRGAGGEVLQLGRAGDPAGHDQLAQQVGAQDVAGVLRWRAALGRRQRRGGVQGRGRVRGRCRFPWIMRLASTGM